MKALSKLMVAIAAIVVSAPLVSCKDTIISPDQLPAAAQAFIKEHFPESTISFAKKDAELSGTTYEVTLQDGTEIDFDRKGVWDKVDCHDFQAVPATIIPAPIAAYVQTNFSTFFITKIDKEHYGYSIELSNDIELKFDKLGNLIGVDD